MSKTLKKITDLEYFIDTTREVKDSQGNRSRKKANIKVKHTVNTLSSDRRLLHYLIDLFLIKCLLFLFYVIIGQLEFQDFSFSTILSNYNNGYFILIFLLYYAITESLFQKSLGKFLTKSIVVDSFGNKHKALSMLFRTLGRLVPFDGLAIFLGYRALHDLASETFVIHNEEIDILRKLQNDELNKIVYSVDEKLTN